MIVQINFLVLIILQFSDSQTFKRIAQCNFSIFGGYVMGDGCNNINENNFEKERDYGEQWKYHSMVRITEWNERRCKIQ